MRTNGRTEEPPLEIIFEEPRRGKPGRWPQIALAAVLLGVVGYCGVRLYPRPQSPQTVSIESIPEPRPSVEPAVERAVRPKLEPLPIKFVQEEAQETKETQSEPPPPSDAEKWIEEAKKIEESDPAQAAELYSKALVLEPERADLWPHVARLWIRAGNSDAAVVAVQSYLLKHPGDERSLNTLAILEMRAGHLDSAVELLQRAVLAKPSAPLWFNLGNVHARRGELEKAADAYRNSCGFDAAYLPARYNWALVLERLGRVGDAAAALEEATGADPETRAHRGRLMALAGGARADRIFEEARKIDDPQVLRTVAEGLEASGKFEHALAVLDRAVELAPKDGPILHNRGALRQRMGDLDRAAEDYALALQASPQSAETHFNLGTLHEARGSYVKALESYQSALRIQPRHEGSLINVGALYLRIKDAKRAAALFEQAVKADPKSPRAHLNLAWAYLASDRNAEALAELKAHVALVASVSAEVRRAIEGLEGSMK